MHRMDLASIRVLDVREEGDAEPLEYQTNWFPVICTECMALWMKQSSYSVIVALTCIDEWLNQLAIARARRGQSFHEPPGSL